MCWSSSIPYYCVLLLHPVLLTSVFKSSFLHVYIHYSINTFVWNWFIALLLNFFFYFSYNIRSIVSNGISLSICSCLWVVGQYKINLNEIFGCFYLFCASFLFSRIFVLLFFCLYVFVYILCFGVCVCFLLFCLLF